MTIYFLPLAFKACGNPLMDVGDHVGPNKVLPDEMMACLLGCEEYNFPECEEYKVWECFV